MRRFLLALLVLAACGTSSSTGTGTDGGGGGTPDANTNPQDGPPAGWVDGKAMVPPAGQAEDVSNPTTVIGTGTPDGCTSDAFVAAVAKGGIITFNCGNDPIKIVLTATAKVFNDKNAKL